MVKFSFDIEKRQGVQLTTEVLSVHNKQKRLHERRRRMSDELDSLIRRPGTCTYLPTLAAGPNIDGQVFKVVRSQHPLCINPCV